MKRNILVIGTVVVLLVCAIGFLMTWDRCCSSSGSVVANKQSKQSEGFATSYPSLFCSQTSTVPVYIPQLPSSRQRDWRVVAAGICASYNQDKAPRSIQDCPDSSFDYVSRLSHLTHRPEDNYGSCIQAKAGSPQYCHSLPDGTYIPWWEKLLATSP